MSNTRNESNLLINVDNVSFFSDYDEVKSSLHRKKILDGITVKIKKGEFITILGENGAGKSTFVKHLNALLLPTRGDIFIDGVNTKDKNNILKIRSKIGMILQDPDTQIVNSIVKEDIAFGPENLQIEPEKIKRLVNRSLSLVDMEKYKNSLISELSGGQKQRVAIAGILAMNPECLILDESTSMLDYKSKEKILQIICNLNKCYGTTVIFVTHSTEDVFFSSRVLYMKDGKIVLDIPPLELFFNDFLLEKYNIRVPKMVQFVKKLQSMGIKIPNNVLTVSGLVSKLSEILNNN